MLGTMPECSTMSDQILQYDQALAAPIIVPIGIIACRGRHFHLACEIMIEAGFERADVNIVESARPIRLQTQIPRQTGGFARLIPIDGHTHLGGVAVKKLDGFQAMRCNAGIFVGDSASQPFRRYFGTIPRQRRSEEHTSELQSLIRLSYA